MNARERTRAQSALALATVAALGYGLPFVAPRIDHDAQRGLLKSGNPHPDGCPCVKCAAWRRAERYR